LTCNELHEQITAYVDNRVDAGEYRKKIEQHLAYCPECRAAYEAELTTKMIVRERFARTQASDALRRKIAGELDRVDSQKREEIASSGAEAREDWLDRFASDYLSPVGIGIALVLVLVGGGLLFYTPSARKSPLVVESGTSSDATQGITSNAPINFFNKASDNFDAILAGSLKLQVTTADSGHLEQYFREHGIDYPVRLVPVRVPLAGGVVSEHGVRKFAHMIYEAGDTILYLFEVPHAALEKGDIVYVTSDVLSRLDHGEWIWVEQVPGHPLAMFEREGAVIAAVANVPRPTMEGLLATR
jgi:hypothetical protein